MPRATWAAIAAAGLVVAGVGFHGATLPIEGGRPQAVCGLVIDRTASHVSLGKGDVGEDAAAVVEGCARRDAWLLAYGFDSGVRRTTDLGSYALFPGEGRTAGHREAAREEAVAAAHSAIGSYLSEEAVRGDGGSDILAAMATATDTLRRQAQDEGVDDVLLVVLTDGLQMSADLSVEEITGPEVDTAPLLRRAEDVGLLPSLAGVGVTMLGPNGGDAGGGHRLPAWFEARVESFWSDAVAAGGGRLCHYGAAAPTRIPVDC